MVKLAKLGLPKDEMITAISQNRTWGIFSVHGSDCAHFYLIGGDARCRHSADVTSWVDYALGVCYSLYLWMTYRLLLLRQ